MTLREALRQRRTTNGHFDPRPVSLEHQHLLIEAACRAPSHFNSQPWRFVLVDDQKTRESIAVIAGRTMKALMEGPFFKRYRRYFRFTENEMRERRDGILIDTLPAPLRPFTKQLFSDTGSKVMATLGVPAMLGEDNRKLVEQSPLMLGVMLSKEEYRPGELSAFYCTVSMGMAIEHVWLMCTELNLGIQFISTPMEDAAAWGEIKGLLKVPEDLELMALYRIGYVPEEARGGRISWKSDHRKSISQVAFRNTCDVHEQEANTTL
ncbi:MAG: nitroreductase family protein [bacterium]|nr:nitroreductase family protein [bacterium]